VPTTVTPALQSPPLALPAPPLVRLRLLGEAAIDVDGMPVGPESQVLFALLLVLALERGRRLARTALHRLLWPGADDDSGRHNLRQVLYKLRQLGVPMEATQSSVMLAPSVVTGELVALTVGDPTVGARLAAGGRLGDFLPGYAPAFSAPFADWLDEQRALVQAQLRRALLAALAELRALGQWREVEAVAREVLRADPLNEEATLALAEATALVGAKAQALGIIDRYLDEMGGRPSDLKLPATLLRRRIAERFPTHRYVSAADACFVGRATEMATLLGLWHRARERRGGAVLLWGEPGIGKTRLAHELGRVATLQGAQVQRVASRSWDVQRPLGAIVDLVPGLRELPGAAGVDPRCNEYLDRLTKHDPDRPLADLPDPATLHRQVRQAVFDLVDALLAEAPLVLVLEDVQWLDASSWEVLAELLRLARTRRLLLVLTSRSAHPPQLPEGEDWEALRRLRVDGIDARATNDLLDAMTREAGKYIDPDYREWCVPLANGNPLHVQEIALQWLEKGSVREAPGSLKALLHARISCLPTDVLRTLQVITLAGANSTPQVVASAIDESLLRVLDALQTLEQSGFAAYRDDLLHIRHEVVAEQAVGLMPPGVRALLHDRIAQVLFNSALSANRPGLLWDCYQHWQSASLPGQAVEALAEFCDHLLASGHAVQAEQLLKHAIDLCAAENHRDILRGRLLRASLQLGHWEQVEQLRARADGGDSASSDEVMAQYEARWKRSGDVAQLQAEASHLARQPLLNPRTRIRAAAWAIIFADNAGDDECAVRLDPIARPLLSLLDSDDCFALHYLMLSANQRCDTDSLRQVARQLSRAAALHTPDLEQIRLLRNAAQGLSHAGEVNEAIVVVLEAYKVAGRIRATHAMAACAEAMAQLHLYTHDVASVRVWAEEADAHYRSSDDLHATQAVSYLLFQCDAAEGLVQAALARLPQLGSPTIGDTNIARNMAQRAVRLRAAVLAGSNFPDLEEETAECAAVLPRCRNLGSQEFVAAAVIHSWCALGQLTKARHFFSDFLSALRFRRGGLHIDLAHAQQRLLTT
jgi:DNA-binding SARP family transcriptional activator